MDAVWVALIAAAGLVFLAAVVAGGVVFFLRLRSREPINLNLRLLFRIYLLVVIVAGLIVFAQGASNLVQAGFASVGGKQLVTSRYILKALPASGYGRLPQLWSLKIGRS